MNKCLITGCGGFIGSYLAEFLLEKGMDIYGTVHHHTENIDHLKDKIAILECNLSDRDKVEEILREVKPDYIYHLAARSLHQLTEQNPETVLQVNITGTYYLLDSINKVGMDPLVEVVCSSAEYGFSYENELPIKEDKEFRPSSLYGASKVAQDMLTYSYWQAYKMRIIRVRPFLIIGPRITIGALADFARGITEIERGQKDVLSVGSLDTVRDFVDVRDCVRAMWLLAEKGIPGEVYNICSGKGFKIGDILDKLVALSANKIEVHQDPQKLRPADEPVLVGNNSKLRRLGWETQIDIEKTLSDILSYWRANA